MQVALSKGYLLDPFRARFEATIFLAPTLRASFRGKGCSDAGSKWHGASLGHLLSPKFALAPFGSNIFGHFLSASWGWERVYRHGFSGKGSSDPCHKCDGASLGYLLSIQIALGPTGATRFAQYHTKDNVLYYYSGFMKAWKRELIRSEALKLIPSDPVGLPTNV